MCDEPQHQPAFIALGSNIRPEFHLPAAVCELARLGTVERVSSVWESAPVGFVHQPRFCNAAVLLRTSLTPSELKSRLRDIESRLGRVRDPHNRNAPRTIDLDIALFGNLVATSPELRIPDPDIELRSFLAVPLAELNGEFPHPVSGQSLSRIAAGVPGADDLACRRDIPLIPLQ